MSAHAEALTRRIDQCQRRIEGVLAALLADQDAPTATLLAAMRYSVLGGGKRLRPLLVYVTGQAFGADLTRLDACAAAVEIIHAYSLIHDDLPAMDNDDLRRGRPTCHRAFDEGVAILAGDALQAMAFDILATQSLQSHSASNIVRMIATLASAIGPLGMAGGQAIDLAATGKKLDGPALELMHRRKTGALIQASVELGAIAAGVEDAAALAGLRQYGAEIGLAFQIQDDILDVTGDTATLGKKQGADALLDKPTYPAVLGLEASRREAVRRRDLALEALGRLGEQAEELRALARYVVDRRS